MRVDVIAVGKVRAEHFRAAADDYIHRLRRYGRFAEVEVREGRGRVPEVKAAEGAALLAAAPAGAVLYVLDEHGDELTSEGLAEELRRRGLHGDSKLAFVIGGAEGLDSAVLARAAKVVSLSKMTLPHELARVVLWEQLYRAMTILRGEPYHRGGGAGDG